MEVTVWSWDFAWHAHSLWNNKWPISLGKVVGFSQAWPKVLWNKSAIPILKKALSMMHHSCLCYSSEKPISRVVGQPVCRNF